MQRTSAWPLALTCIVLIVYASLYPFGEWRDQGLSPFSCLWSPLPRYWTGFDVAANLLGYFPLGFLLALTALPNPSATGVFRVQLATDVTPGTQLTVFDGLGRVVLAHELTATATGTTSFGLDLHRERPGLYTLHVASPAGVATQKLLVE